MTRRPRVVIAGLGDTGLLTAIHLAKDHEVVGVATKPGFLSGQELGQRLAQVACGLADALPSRKRQNTHRRGEHSWPTTRHARRAARVSR